MWHIVRKTKRFTAGAATFLLAAGLAAVVVPDAQGVPVPVVGNGFTVTASDLAFILKQIKIAEAHAANTTSATGPCGALLGTGPDQLPSPLISLGLRTVDGSCNNLVAGRERAGAADTTFPRLTTPVFQPAGPVPPGFGPAGSTSYAQKKGNVFDTAPRVISNLIVDQTSTNPAAIAAAGRPVRTQGATGVKACTTDPDPLADPPVLGVPAGCTPSFQTLFIPNVTTDVGLSPPYNSLFTLFGQFFDHGVDQTVKGGGTVFVPLKSDDPLIAGPDHILVNNPATAVDESADNLPPQLQFMVLTRAQNQPGADGIVGDDPATAIDESADDIQNAANTDTSWVDQSQTYTSHSSHQVFLREYATVGGRPVATGKLLGGTLPAGAPAGQDPGMSTWATTKEQAATKLGIQLVDKDVTNIPMLAADAYGNFIPGPARGMAQYVTETGLVEGDTAAPVLVPANVKHFDTPFLTDIAHNADPGTVGPCTSAIGETPRVPTGCLSPDGDTTASADFANQVPGTYDDEMLNAHFTAGDGRVNENIGLTTIHQVFHSEHNRLIDYVKDVLSNDTSARGVAALTEWQSAAGAGGWNGGRLFQAARFVNEMEYQHIVFEEFARKVQPAINPFEVFAFTQPDLNPSVRAEFAHAVYRFGHSMLTETISRRNPNGTPNDISLLNGFLNPPEYTNGGAAGTLTAQQAAGSVIMGMSDQTGNELDEFVTDTLRNNLLGLPLDLPTINMTRARSEGVPPLNQVRRQLFARTNDGQLAPYKSWVDFGENIKHPESLINFVAAYGQHPTVLYANAGADGILVDDPATAVDETDDNGPPTLASRRAAAKRIVDPAPGDPNIPADAAAFMNSVTNATGNWANAGNASITGLDKVDLWMGGLAENTNLFGGLLGTTFNYVFENQMTDLQNGDRFYYLARTPGMNLRAQLEGNSFAELMMRNTDVNTLKADSFATADCKFQLENLAGTPAGFAADGNTVSDDPASECNETALLLRQPDGTIQYRAVNSVNPPGINGQSVYNGTPGADRVHGGNDNDTTWGGPGNDVIEGAGGSDVSLGGDGNDIITDSAGDDQLKGGPGNDAIDGGPGLDVITGGDGTDFTNGGANANATFIGPGDDFMILGQGADLGIGDGGDDWLEGGDQPDGLVGDSSNLFFLDDSQTPGNDVLNGQGGDDDYDMEGGDDIGIAGVGIDKVAGASGYDWQIAGTPGQGEAAAQDMDLDIPLVPLDILAVGVRDKFNETEALSGGQFNDILRGTSIVPANVGGGGFIGCDVLDQAGVNRISGLNLLLPPLTGDTAAVVAASASKFCPVLSGPSWGEGNILLGGAGSDLIEGRGADDIIDGDKSLGVRISVRTDPANAGTEIGSADLMENQYLRDSTGALTGPTLQAAVFAGTVDPGNLVTVREIVAPTAAETAGNIDTAVFTGPKSNYSITVGAGFLTVNQTGANVALQKVSDGIDTLRNIEKLKFSDQTVILGTPGAPLIGTAVAGNTTATVNWTAPVDTGTSPLSSFNVLVLAGPSLVQTISVPAPASSFVVTGLTNDTAYNFVVQAVNASGTSADSGASNIVTPVAPVVATVPGAPTIGTATAGNTTATVNWTAPASDGGTPITGYSVLVLNAANAQVGALRPASAGTISLLVTGLTNATAYHFQVTATNSVGTGVASASSNTVTPSAAATAPAAPLIGTATPGNTTATVNWTAPASNGGSVITLYRVRVVNAANAQVGALRPTSGPVTTLVVTGLTNGSAYRFQVRAVNAIGAGAFSALSNTVTPDVVPGAPGIRGSIDGTAGGVINATARWSAPVANGGTAITGYRVTALRMSAAGAVLATTLSAVQPAAARQFTMTLSPAGNYRFTVQAINAAGSGPQSARSNLAVAR